MDGELGGDDGEPFIGFFRRGEPAELAARWLHFVHREVARKKFAIIASIAYRSSMTPTPTPGRRRQARSRGQCDAPQEYDGRQQALIIERMLAEKVEGVGIGPIDSPQVRQSLSAAAAQGVKIVFFDTDLSGIPHLGFIGTDNKEPGGSSVPWR